MHQAIASLAFVIVASAAFAFFGAQEVDKAATRSRNAQATLAAHITISNSAYNLFKQMSDATLLNETGNREWEARLVGIVRRDIAAARRAIVEEVKEIGDREDETDELERLAAIEHEIESIIMEYGKIRARLNETPPREKQRDIAALLDTRIDLTFNKLVSSAIAEERREVAEADARLATVSGAIRAGAVAIFLFAAPLVLLALVYVNRTLLTSLRALSEGADAYARGDFDHAIAHLPSEEFDSIRRRLVKMASELSSSRRSLRESHDRLEKEVTERTAALAEAKRRLAESDEARRNFFVDVSHELRTPLTVIRGEAEVALRGGERRALDYRESLVRIVEQASMMGRMVEDLLVIARADAGEPRLEMRSVAVNALLADAASAFQSVAAARGVSLRRLDSQEGFVVVGDRERLLQAIGVLLDNAIRYSREGGEVRISAAVDAGQVVLVVEDDGIGIAEEEVPRIFDRFYRGANAREHSGAGVGLGLSVAKAIIEAHNGHIRLSASASGGVAASVTLPVEAKLRAIS
ncbi:MAG: sensor histidine kinase [Parvularculaceae bacterium]